MFFLFLDATVKIDFLRKCKEAGLLNDLFEEILDKLHLIQERLMRDTASDSGTETTFLHVGTSHKPTCKTNQKYTFSFYAISSLLCINRMWDIHKLINSVNSSLVPCKL